MPPAAPLDPGLLRRRCDPADVPFETTSEVVDFTEVVGQERAVEALRFGIAIRREGYNFFALGPHGTGKQTLLRQYLDRQAAGEATPGDCCHVQSFGDAHRPRLLKLPPGIGSRLRQDMERLVAELQIATPAAFESEEYRTRKQQISKRFEERQEAVFSAVQERAKKEHVAVMRTSTGVLLAPLRDGQVLEADRFRELPQDERQRLQAAMERAGEDLSAVFREAREAEREQREAQRALDRELAATVARRHLDELRAQYRELPEVLRHLGDVENDVVKNADDFLHAEEEGLHSPHTMDKFHWHGRVSRVDLRQRTPDGRRR